MTKWCWNFGTTETTPIHRGESVMIKSRKRKTAINALIGLLILTTVVIGINRIRVEGSNASSQKESLRPANGNRRMVRSEEDIVRDAYARLMRYQAAARHEASARLSITYKPQDYIIFSINDMRTGVIEEILDRPLLELVTPR